jgi:ParB family chromosome partitioning protein
MTAVTSDRVIQLALDQIDLFVHQSRSVIDEKELDWLAENMRANGQLQAGVAAFDSGRQRYILICGERRYRALKRIGAATMDVGVLEGDLSLSRMLEINISENLQRQDLNPIECAKAFHRLKQLEGLTSRQVAERLRISDAKVSRDLSLLDLSPALQVKVISGALPASVASLIVRLEHDDARRELVEKYESGELTREAIASEVKAARAGQKTGKPSRVAFRHDGISISVAGQALTLEAVNAALDQLKKQAKSLIEASQKKQPANAGA